MPSVIKLWLKLAVNPLTTAVPKIGQIWSNGMANNAEKMDDRRKASISDEITYLSKLAEPAEQEYQRVLDPTFVSRKGKGKHGINITQAFKIKKAWRKYERNWDHQFETVDGIPAKRFKERVQASKDTYAEGASRIPLALTGIKTLESGPVRIALYWLTGDVRARGLLRPADQIVVPSEPYNITIVEKRNSLRQVLNSRLIQSGAAILHAQLADTVITEMNTLDNSIVQGFINPLIGLQPFTLGGDSHLDFIKENEQLYLSVKVSTV